MTVLLLLIFFDFLAEVAGPNVEDVLACGLFFDEELARIIKLHHDVVQCLGDDVESFAGELA